MTQSHDNTASTFLGFWTYLMTDCILFATLFATYIVLKDHTFGGPSSKQLFHLPFALTETFILLMSSFTCGLASIYAYHNKKKRLIFWFAITFILGLSFVLLEWHEFTLLTQAGNDWSKSAFLSSYFTLVATHGIHVSIGLLWMIVLLIPVMKQGLTPVSMKRLSCLKLFWHFLDVVWIFIFTIVYLMGAY